MRYKSHLDYTNDLLIVRYDDDIVWSTEQPNVGKIRRVLEIVEVANWCHFEPNRLLLSLGMMD